MTASATLVRRRHLPAGFGARRSRQAIRHNVRCRFVGRIIQENLVNAVNWDRNGVETWTCDQIMPQRGRQRLGNSTRGRVVRRSLCAAGRPRFALRLVVAAGQASQTLLRDATIGGFLNAAHNFVTYMESAAHAMPRSC